MRPTILSLIPLAARKVRDAISNTIPGFKYGGVTDHMFLNGPQVGRDLDVECECICNLQHWKPYRVPLVDGFLSVVTTDTSCLRNKNAAAVLGLQAKFRADYCPRRSAEEYGCEVAEGEDEIEVVLFADMEHALTEHVSDLCEAFVVSFVPVSEWRIQVLEEIWKRLGDADGVSGILPLTAHIDFEDARKEFRRLRKSSVFSRVDKASCCIN